MYNAASGSKAYATTGYGGLDLVGVLERCVSLSSKVPPTFSYPAPRISGVNPNHGGTSGGYAVVVTGSDFGPPRSGQMVAVDVIRSEDGMGMTKCRSTTWVGPGRLSCIMPAGVGIRRRMVVMVGNQRSAESYDFRCVTAAAHVSIPLALQLW